VDTPAPAERPLYTEFYNVLLDEVMPTLSPAAWKVLSCILRQTVGWHRDEWPISYSQTAADAKR
jgi:hypothetical protein